MCLRVVMETIRMHGRSGHAAPIACTSAVAAVHVPPNRSQSSKVYCQTVLTRSECAALLGWVYASAARWMGAASAQLRNR